MPPKVKTTKDAIVEAAVALVRTQGAAAINARTLAEILGCSTQPIFSNFATMQDLRVAVAEEAYKIFCNFLKREIESGDVPVYKANGMAYIRFAKEERELFKLLYMSEQPLPRSEGLFDDMEQLVRQNTGLTGTDSKLFHLEIWAFVHGIATMFATGYLNLEWELVSQMVSDMYGGLRKQYETEGSR